MMFQSTYGCRQVYLSWRSMSHMTSIANLVSLSFFKSTGDSLAHSLASESFHLPPFSSTIITQWTFIPAVINVCNSMLHKYCLALPQSELDDLLLRTVEHRHVNVVWYVFTWWNIIKHKSRQFFTFLIEWSSYITHVNLLLLHAHVHSEQEA